MGGVEIAADDPVAGVLSEPGADQVVAALVDGLVPVEPRATVRASILAEIQHKGRLARFADKIAALADVSLEKARELLDRVARTSLWERDLVPGLDALWVEGGPAVAQCIRGFARLDAGAPFPIHKHLGDETTLVLEGAMIESSGHVIRPGQTYDMTAGSEHSYRAEAGGTDLLFFVVVREGLTLEDGSELKHRDGPAAM